jgi:hypothetical protein
MKRNSKMSNDYEIKTEEGIKGGEVWKNKIRDIERSRFILCNNKDVTDFILSFFELENKKGARCRVWTKELEDGKQILARYGRNQKLISLGKENIMKQLFEGHTTYFYEFIFDSSGIGNAFTKMQKKKQIIGISPVMDIDAPSIYENEGTKNEYVIGRESMFDYIDDFNNTIGIIENELKEVEIEWNMSSSGNGIYIIGKPFYSENQEEIYKYADKFVEIIDDVNHVKENKLEIHDNAKAWSYYYKIPFSFHVNRQRISIPLRKGKLDEQWLDKMTDIRNLSNNNCKNFVGEILNKAQWK